MRRLFLRRRLLWPAVVLAAVALLALGLRFYAGSWRPPLTEFPSQGVDVSAAAGAIDWPTLAAEGADFAYVRATAGSGERDAQFDANWQGVAAAGIPRGALHVYSLCGRAADQARNFVTTVPRTDDALPAAMLIDFEPDCAARPDRKTLLQEIGRFINAVETHTGKPMLLKVTKPVEAAYQLSGAVARPVWAVANYFSPEYAVRPWRMWQANSARHVAGAEAPVHWNVVAR